MAATMVGADWGMLALGINNVSGKTRETVASAKGPTTRDGEDAISDVAIEVRRGDVFAVLGPNGSGTRTMRGTLLGPVQTRTSLPRPSLSTTEDWLMKDDDAERAGRSAIIHAFHGVSPSGTWFLLADVAPNQLDSSPNDDSHEPAFDGSWLVILGRRDRDIITLQGQDA